MFNSQPILSHPLFQGPTQTFLSVPGRTTTRRRSTSVPAEPTSDFHSLRRTATRPSSPVALPPSLSTSPSLSSFDSLQLPEDFYDYIPSYQPSPEFPFLEINGLDIYSHPNSSVSSLTSLHSTHSPLSLPFPGDPLPDFPSDINTEEFSINITDADNTTAHHPDEIFSHAEPHTQSLSGFLHSSILDPSTLDDDNALRMASFFGPPFPSTEAAAPPEPSVLFGYTHPYTGSQPETPAVDYPLPGGHDSYPRMSPTAVQAMQTIHNHQSPLWSGTALSTPSLGGRLGSYYHDKAGGSGHPSSHATHHLVGIAQPSNVLAVGPSLPPGPFPPPGNTLASPEASSPRRPSRISENNNLDPQFEAKKMVYKTLTESSSKAKAFAKIAELASKMKWNLIRSVFDEAAQRNVKSTPAGQQRAKDRRSRPPTFLCILCPGRFTTNNNLQNHYRSHLRMDQYRCPRCGDYFRTEGIRKRHTDNAQKCRRHDSAAKGT